MKKIAEFYRCALQVNPYSYMQYRGTEHEIDEDEYNEKILENCKKAKISVVGLADHGDVVNSEKLRKVLQEGGITVFPGFEIASAEKIHMVCLFSENTSISQLERYLGKLDISGGVLPSKFSCLELSKIINDDLNGFWYAAHITGDNGILKIGKMNHIWKSSGLRAAQIPSTRINVDPNYKNIINNKDPQYKREKELAYINAKDISKPEEILDDEASCLVKMSKPSFDCFKKAFCDPVARVKLVSDLETNYYSYIKNISINGGYLDGLNLDLSKHLNTLIGGRGTGKSTLIEIIRYALDLEAKSEYAKSSSKSIVEANLGNEKGRVELTLVSNKQFGREFKVIKRYGEPVVIKNSDGTISNLSIEDIIPNIEIYGQNEILEIAKDEDAKMKILNRFLPNSKEHEVKISKLRNDLDRNKTELMDCLNKEDELESELLKLPALYEKKKSFIELGIEDKLKNIDIIKVEESNINNISNEIESYKVNLDGLNIELNESLIKDTLNKDIFKDLDELIKGYNNSIKDIKKDIEKKYEELKESVELKITSWNNIKANIDSDIESSVKKIHDMNGKTGKEIATEYENTLNEISLIEPKKLIKEENHKKLEELKNQRRKLLEDRDTEKDILYDQLRKTIKKINKKQLKNKVKINLRHNENRSQLTKYLMGIPGLGAKSIDWVKKCDNLSIKDFISDIRIGNPQFYEKYKGFGLTSSKAETILKLNEEQLMELEVVDLLDIIDIQLNISKDNEMYKSLSSLSKGQQCTAILYLLLLDNKDPLIVDQPEDNLDNSFIANNLVDVLRDNKIKRQFIFATHNANIPVFGDSECICVMEEVDGEGVLKDDNIGSIDDENISISVVNTLEGGKTAFNIRKEKYNF